MSDVERHRRPRVRAPELAGDGGWINTSGRDLSLADLRGRTVVLHFWTFCCVNCLHVLDELRVVEQRHRDDLVVLSVHSPKFAHEADHQAVVDAVERHGIAHPVLDDPAMHTWKQYAVRAWPTLAVIDPEGYVVAQLVGEGHGHALDALLTDLVAEHRSRGTLRPGERLQAPTDRARTELRFPGKALRLPSSTLLVSDSGHHTLAETTDDGTAVLRRIGVGRRELRDGGPRHAAFAEPQGMVLLPAEVAAHVGYDIVVADTGNHALRGVSLATGSVRTVAGTGRQRRPGAAGAGPAREVDLSSPWDVAWFGGRVVVAMAGVHQLWEFDPVSGLVAVLAGTAHEGLHDGPLEDAWFAQPSGLTVSADGRTLWVADAETSALRRLRDGRVDTAVGEGLFDFGHRDGAAGQALLQHPLGVCALRDGSVVVADTYNDALRRYDPVSETVHTVATGLREPSAAVLVPDVDGVHLAVVESAAHRVRMVRLGDASTVAPGAALRLQRPVTVLAPGPLDLDVRFVPPPGQHLDERYGPATRLLVEASPQALLAAGGGAGTGLHRELELAAPAGAAPPERAGEGVLHVSATAASCDDDQPGDTDSHPACHVHQQDWGIPVRVAEGGLTRLTLVLAGPMDDPEAAGGPTDV